mgnify:FL=1
MVSASAFADVNVNLNQEDKNVGRLDQTSRSPGHLTIRAKRTSITPEEVDLHFSYKYETTVCARFMTDRYWVPGHCRWVYRGGRRHRVCSRGYYRTRTYCARYEQVVQTKTREVELDFEKAATLSASDVELFEINIEQERFRSDDIDLTASVIQSDEAYKIKIKSGISGKKIKFKLR